MMTTTPRVQGLTLRNIRCFDEITLDFGGHGSGKDWIFLLGDNGTGKSTILRCLILGLASEKEAYALFEAPRTEWLRKGENSGSITVYVEIANGLTVNNEVQIELSPSGEVLRHVRADEAFMEAIWYAPAFVAAYGPSRARYGSREGGGTGYSIREASATLFEPEARLQNPELAVHRMLRGGTPESDILGWMDKLLMLPEGSVRLGPSGIEVAGAWQNSIPTGSLSDGYRAMITWIADLVGWALQHQQQQRVQSRDGYLLDVTGIVVVDELEQHLHPEWQRRIVELLRVQFPRVQFIATTHSPLCVIGTTALSDEEVSLAVLRMGMERVSVIDCVPPPRGQRADQVLTSFLFGLSTSRDVQTSNEINQLAALLGHNSHDQDSTSLTVEELRTVLNAKLGSEETETERLLAPYVDAFGEAQLHEKLRTASPNLLSSLAAELDASMFSK